MFKKYRTILVSFQSSCVCIPSSKVVQHGKLGIPELKLTNPQQASIRTNRDTTLSHLKLCDIFILGYKTKLGKQTREKFKIGSNDVSPSFSGKQKVVPTAKKRYFINGGFQSTFKYYQIKFWKNKTRKNNA